MKEQDQIKALAEVDAYEADQHLNDEIHFHRGSEPVVYFHELNYLTSFDAIIPLVQKQTKEVRENIAINLWTLHGIDSDWAESEAWAQNFLTTPAQLCEALLRARGLWKD